MQLGHEDQTLAVKINEAEKDRDWKREGDWKHNHLGCCHTSPLRSKHYFVSNLLTVLKKVKMWRYFHNHIGTPASTQRAHEKLKFGGKQCLNIHE